MCVVILEYYEEIGENGILNHKQSKQNLSGNINMFFKNRTQYTEQRFPIINQNCTSISHDLSDLLSSAHVY